MPGVSTETRTRARFLEVPLEAGHYESFYLKAAHPSEPLAAWIRYTVHKRPGAEPLPSLWFTLFDGASDGPYAAKLTLARRDLTAGSGDYIGVGESRFAPGRVEGELEKDDRSAAWALDYRSEEPALLHLPRGWMYRAALPRTKLLSPHPAARFSGSVRAGDRRLELDGWPGMVGHNWGAEHAERWIWLHAAKLDGAAGESWIDVALGRVRAGPVVTPWIANGALSLDGVRHRLGGPERAARTEVGETPSGCECVLPGRGLTAFVTVSAAPKDFVGWVYADPDGSRHDTINCSIADLTARVVRREGGESILTSSGGAAYELGMRERDHGVPIQAAG